MQVNPANKAKAEVPMGIHQDILEIVNKRILPEVVRVHQMDVPYPAELWVNGTL